MFQRIHSLGVARLRSGDQIVEVAKSVAGSSLLDDHGRETPRKGVVVAATVTRNQGRGQRARVPVAQRFEVPPIRRPKPWLAPDHVCVTPDSVAELFG